MRDETKNLIDVILSVLTIVGAGVAFLLGLYQWKRSQAWQRAEQLNKFIEKFEADDLLRLATLVIDWTDRETRVDGRPVTFWNDEALLALRDHNTIKETPMFPGEQATLRDAYDALLAFFTRLELGISTRLIDAKPSASYFAYWLNHFLSFDKHPDDNSVLKGAKPSNMVWQYITVYGDPESVRRLCDHFEIACATNPNAIQPARGLGKPDGEEEIS